MIEELPFEAFCRRFDSEQACADALFRVRWPDGFRCSSCRHRQFYLISTRRLPLYQCRSCSLQTSATAGTIMEKSRTPLTSWFQAIFLLSQPDGISALRLSDILQVTYKTAWLIAHKIRHAMQKSDERELLSGVVRVDRIHYGYQFYRDARQPLLIGGSLNGNGNPHHVKIKQPDPSHVRNDSRYIDHQGIEAFVNQNLNKSATTEWARGNGRHPQLNQLSRKVTQWLNDTFQGIGPKHLQAYLDEFCYRLNRKFRELPVIGELLHNCATTETITYVELTCSKPVLPVPWVVWGSKGKWKGRHLSLWNA